MNDAYVQGFIDKCAEHGVDPETLIKVAQTAFAPPYNPNAAPLSGYNRAGSSFTAANPTPRLTNVGQNVGNAITRNFRPGSYISNLGGGMANTSLTNPMGNNPVNNPVAAVPGLNMVQRGAGVLGGLTSQMHPIQAAGRGVQNMGQGLSRMGQRILGQ